MLNEHSSGQGLVAGGQQGSGQGLVASGQQNPSLLATHHSPLPTAPKRTVRALGWTPEQDALIRWTYGSRTMGERQDRIKVLLTKIKGRTATQCYCRAAQLGCLYALVPNRRFWTPEEDELIERWAHLKPPALSKRLERQGYHRSPSAIIRRRLELGHHYRQARADAGVYTAQEAAPLLGCSNVQVGAFIQRGWLPARKVGDGQRFAWHITAAALRDFIIHHTAYVRLEKVDKYQFIDLLCPRHGLKSPGSADTAGIAGEDETVAKGHFVLGAYA